MRSYRIARAIRMRRRFAPSGCNWSWRLIRIIRRRRTMRSRLWNYRATWNGGIQKSDEARLDGKRRRKISELRCMCNGERPKSETPDLGLFAWAELRADCGGQKSQGDLRHSTPGQSRSCVLVFVAITGQGQNRHYRTR